MSSAQGGGKGNDGAQVRVVIITTQYIETDPANFKSVVQRLTGKHSHDDHIESLHQPPPRRPRGLSPLPSVSQLAASSTAGVMGARGNNMNASSLPPPPSSSSSVMFSSGVSLSDLDRLHTLPSWEEISRLVTELHGASRD